MPPSSSTSSSDAARLGRPWAVALLVIALVEGGLALAGPTTAPIDVGLRFYAAATEPTVSESMVHWQVTRPVQAADVLILGDSSALTAVVPRVLTEALGVVVENQGTIAPLGIRGHLRVLERYLARVDQPPKVLIYHFSDGTFAVGQDETDRIGSFAALEDWLGVAPLQQLGPPSYHLRPWARHAVGGGQYPEWPNDQGIAQFILRTQGFLREPSDDYDWANYTRLQVPIHPDTLAPLQTLLERTAGQGIHVLLVRGPVPAIAADPQARAEHQANAQFFRQVAGSSPHIHLAEPYLRVLPTEAFGTPNHPKLPGAQANSRWLGQLVKPLLAAQ